jgi:uncharacterized protein (TIRG00374 family)
LGTSSSNSSRGRRLATIGGILVSGGLLLLAGWRLEWRQVGQALGQARLWPWLPAAMACYLFGHLVRGVRCRLLLSRAKLGFGTAANVVITGYAVNNLLPARAGELARAALIKQRSGLPYAEALTVTAVERLLDGLAIVGLFFVSAQMLALPAAWRRSSWLVVSLFAAGALGLTLLVIFPGACTQVASRLTRRLPARYRERLLRLTAQVTAGVSALARPRGAVLIVLLSAAIWLVESAPFLLLLPALGLPAVPAWAILAMSVTNLGLLVPSTPGFIGPFHFFCMQALLAVGAPSSQAFAYAVLVHATFYVPVTLWGLAVLFHYGVEFTTLRMLARTGKQAEGLSPQPAVVDLPTPATTVPERPNAA